jgi:hypothetical protein
MLCLAGSDVAVLIAGPVYQAHGDPAYFIAAPIRATTVKRTYESGPVTTCAAGLG